jgi:hypothetical protein
MNWKNALSVSLIFIVFLLTGCNTNHPTGSATGALIGAGAGAGGVALLGGPKPLMVAAGLGGGAIGYYVTTLRYDSGGIIHSGGKVYRKGNLVGIYIPGDELFEPNTDEFTSQAPAILDSTADVLKRYPDNNIIISGNTTDFGKSKWERRLSQKRAQKVSSYLWNAGINQFKGQSIETRKLTYAGYGDLFPLSSTLTNKGIRENNRVQITSYPTDLDLCKDRKRAIMRNVGGTDDNLTGCGEGKTCGQPM